MDTKRKTKTAKMLAGLCTTGILAGASLSGGFPAAAAVLACDSYEDLDDEALFEEYADNGIERKGGGSYYKDKRVKVIKDKSANGSVYRFDPKLKGSVSIKIVRNSKGKIKRISYLSKEEAERLIKRAGLSTGDE